MDKCKAASSVSEMRTSTVDEPTAKRHQKLINKDDIDIIKPEEEEEIMANKNENENKNENMMSGLCVNPKFIKLLKRGELLVESLTTPPVGLAIDYITFPNLPPIKTLEGHISYCSTPFEKQLARTDMDISQDRLAICRIAGEELLSPMLKTGEDLRTGINVTVYDEEGKGFPMVFQSWAGGFIYVLTKGWKTFCLKKEFKEHEDWVTIWMFRLKYTNGIYFAIIPRRFPITKLIHKAPNKGSRRVVKKE